MNTMTIAAIAAAAGFSFATAAAAESMSKKQYETTEKAISADFKAAKEKCKSLAGNANDVCIAEAKGNEGVAKAELEAGFKPSAKAHYLARVAKADAVYGVSLEQCDAKAGNDKDVCVKEAKAAKVHAVADAETQMKTWKANSAANETSSEASAKASAAVADAHHDAASEKRDADFAVARQKCDSLAGAAKDLCVSDAKTRFGK